MKKGIISIALLWVAACTFAQVPMDGYYSDNMDGSSDRLDAAYMKRDLADKKPLDYQYVREADVFWAKRIWRIIDVRQKLNLPFAYPPEPLVQILHEAALNGTLTVYDPAVENPDQFKKPMSIADIEKVGTRIDSQWMVDPVTLADTFIVINEPLKYNRVIKYRIKEDWFFDANTSTMQVRIIGIAPVIEDYDEQGNYRGDMTMYWIYYPDIRPLMATKAPHNAGNDATMYSWDDLMEMRKFESYIYKESNVYDRNIQEYASGIDAQLESERIKQQMFEFEHDLWNH
jgi:gliding motility associated protien GldN